MRFGRWVAGATIARSLRSVASRGLASQASRHATAQRRAVIQNLGKFFLKILSALLRAPLHHRREDDHRASSLDGAGGWCVWVRQPTSDLSVSPRVGIGWVVRR